MALDFLAGSLGGCAGLLAGYPFDTVKIRGLYKGMSSPLAGVAFVNSIIFGVQGNVRRRLSNPDSLRSHAIAGAAAGLAQSFICSPVELAKIRIQLNSMNNNVPKTTSPFCCIREIARKQGARGVFKGLGITMAREVPAFGAYFFTYEYLTRSSTGRPLKTLEILLAGGLAGMVSWIVCYPADVIKSRLQADISSQYNGIWDCIKKSVQSEGYRVFTRGLGSTLLRAFPNNAPCFFVVSSVIQIAERFSKEERKTPTFSHSEIATYWLNSYMHNPFL